MPDEYDWNSLTELPADEFISGDEGIDWEWEPVFQDENPNESLIGKRKKRKPLL